MRNDYSAINDLYGVEPDRRQPRRWGSVWLVIAVILAGLFFYESIRPVKHLRGQPPSGFVVSSANRDASELSRQEGIARSYWELAVDSVQHDYPFGTNLPTRPPDDFRLQDEGDSGARFVYWNKLRELWKQPEIWATSYEWNTDWVEKALASVLKVAKEYLHL